MAKWHGSGASVQDRKRASKRSALAARASTGATTRRILLAAFGMLTAAVLGGCSSALFGSDMEESGEPGTAKPVELVWYYPEYEANADLEQVNEAVNRIVKAKLNATVRLMPIEFGSYEQKMNTLAASNEPADIIWTSNWLFSWTDNAKRGVFRPVQELLPEFAPRLLASLPDRFWNDGKLNGNQYGIPSYQIAAMRPSLVIQKRFADKYGLDAGSIRKIEDIEPFLKLIKEGEPGIVPFGTTRGFYMNTLYGIDWRVPVYLDDPSHTVLPDVTEEMKSNFELVRSWYVKGYINEDAATLREASDAYSKGNAAVWFDPTGKPGSEAEFKTMGGGYDVQLVPLVAPYFTGAVSSMNAISRTSKNPERALMFLELVNTDKELYNLLVYGIEGKHYVKTVGNFIRLDPDAGYYTNTDWVFGDIRNEYLPEGSPADKLEQTVRINEEARLSSYAGFEFDGESVKAELANVRAVNEEYYGALATGTVDPDEYLPIYEEQLKKAGSDVIVAEKQRQLNEWLASQGLK
ncbi:ABC transporter substrate-binding protein [Cohnella thailandensis]|uniref:ABC transporter substrate-binding protein n=1 Tax=Cohnella thailandensis TaxID=557557 RepID=A0A841STX6_9BACL|nr:ABC transporter substrate-binding protein [Cohnella thailandensis]MBB6635773.1 ABC transporter substrate-binding protein [Cohnella thailandensis]MBP1976151.1 putative aldouronate transport system substrate-binding protein [Cohnella thailandensis]